MSDFDDVLERLLVDPSFAAALGANPDAALSGYRLDAGEAELLRSQVAGDSAADAARVETRTNKSSTFGLLAPLAAIGELADPGHAAGLGPAVHQGVGDAPGSSWGTGGGAAVRQGLGDAPGSSWGTGGGAAVHQGLGSAPGVHQGLGDGPPMREGLGAAPHQGLGDRTLGSAHPEQTPLPPGYHPRVDVDGDGHWDHATYRADPDGHGAEILVDRNHDGRVDFVGHDTNLDGKVDYADYDTDHDGVFEKRMYDDNGDGWLDRTVQRPSTS